MLLRAGMCCIPGLHGAQHGAAPSHVWGLCDGKTAKVGMKRGNEMIYWTCQLCDWCLSSLRTAGSAPESGL